MPLSDTAFEALSQRLAAHNDGEAMHTVEIAPEELAELTREQAQELVARYGSRTMIPLPEREVEFFNWLRGVDPDVWNDLWGEDETPYLVSLAYLPDLLPRGRGFLICDLTKQPNLWFGAESITREEGVGLLDASINLVRDSGRISMEQAFVVEAWRAPIDVWRFAWMYNRPLDEVKALAAWLVGEGVLLLPETLEAMAAAEEEARSENREVSEEGGEREQSDDLLESLEDGADEE